MDVSLHADAWRGRADPGPPGGAGQLRGPAGAPERIRVRAGARGRFADAGRLAWPVGAKPTALDLAGRDTRGGGPYRTNNNQPLATRAVKAFHTVAVPHDDIMRKKLTMDVFAADLWDAFRGRGSEAYTDPATFFKKTHMTANLEKIIRGVQTRLDGDGGDGFQHIETPFGGGKTHALIAMYHKAKEWGAKSVVVVGTSMGHEETIWGKIEEQLDGRIDVLSGQLAPGREKLERVIEKHGPVLILIDELVQHASVAAGVRLGDTTMAAQIIAFVQQLSEVASTLSRLCVVASLPASVYEMPDRKTAEDLLRMIRKVSGRKEKKITPVDPNDIPDIIRSRLFSSTEDEIREGSAEAISRFVDYCEKEHILPPGRTAVQYRKEFEGTYPFLPQVFEVLYHNWGSFPTFQRTRGVLRLLSLVVYSLKDSDRQYITLSDFDLKDDEIRRELLEHIGDEFDSVISKDITSSDSGARRADQDVGQAHMGLLLGTRAAVAIFMCSFSSGGTNGATINQIKQAACGTGELSSMVGDVVGGFRSKMSYVKSDDDRYLFTSEPNINRLKIDRMESVKEEEMREGEREVLEANVGSQPMRTVVWPAGPRDVDDSPTLKLAIMQDDDAEKCENMLESKGEAPRVHRNSMFFLCPAGVERDQFADSLKGKIALEKILADPITLKPEQKKDVENDLGKEKGGLGHLIRKYYRILYIPNSQDLERYDMGIPIAGESTGIAEQVFEALKSQQQVHESIGPRVMKTEHLGEREHAETASMYERMLSMRGSRRPIDRSVVKEAIRQGVDKKVFGIGTLVDGSPACTHFGGDAPVEFSDGEVIINASVCERQAAARIAEQGPGHPDHGQDEAGGGARRYNGSNGGAPDLASRGGRKEIDLDFDVPEGKMSDAWGILKLVNERFRSIHFRINAKDGSMTDVDVSKISEALRQMGTQHKLK